MSETIYLMSLFDQSTTTADAVDKLVELGIQDENIIVMTGVPYPEQSLGRHKEWIRLPQIVLVGALAGLVFGLFLSVITPQLYPLKVGGRSLVAGPPAAIITYVFTMMATIVSTFLGVLWEMGFPSFEPKHYHTDVTSGQLAVLVELPANLEAEIRGIFESNNGKQIHKPERMPI